VVPEDQRSAPIELGELLGSGSFGEWWGVACMLCGLTRFDWVLTLTTPLVPEDQRSAPIELGELLGSGSFGEWRHT
jgi:hypothetical protein